MKILSFLRMQTRNPHPKFNETAVDLLYRLSNSPDPITLSERDMAMLQNAAETLQGGLEIAERDGRLVENARRVLVAWRSSMDSMSRRIADGAIADIDGYTGGKHGATRLQQWFGLSYAGFAVLSRAMMAQMPDVWQGRMSDLLEEFSETYCNVPERSQDFIVRGAGKGGRMAKVHPAMTDYRRPDVKTLRVWKRQPIVDASQFIDAVLECLNADVVHDEHQWGRPAVKTHLFRCGKYFDPSWDWADAERVAGEMKGNLQWLNARTKSRRVRKSS